MNFMLKYASCGLRSCWVCVDFSGSGGMFFQSPCCVFRASYFLFVLCPPRLFFSFKFIDFSLPLALANGVFGR